MTLLSATRKPEYKRVKFHEQQRERKKSETRKFPSMIIIHYIYLTCLPPSTFVHSHLTNSSISYKGLLNHPN